MPQRARSAQAPQKRPRHAGQGLSFLLFRAEEGREAAREPLCGLPPPPPRPPRTSRPVGSPPPRGPPAAFQPPQAHPGGACRACAGSPLPTNVLCPPPSPRSDGQHCGQTLPPPLWAPSHRIPPTITAPAAPPAPGYAGPGGGGVGACSLRTRPRLSHLVLPVLGEKAPRGLRSGVRRNLPARAQLDGHTLPNSGSPH